MPTDEDNVDLEEDSPTTEDNADSIDDESVKESSAYIEMEKKYKDARKGLDDKAKELKKLKKLEEALKDEPLEEVSSDTDYTDWRADNAEDIKLAGDEYQKQLGDLKDLGVEPTLAVKKKALELALSSKGVTNTSTSVAQNTQSTDRDTNEFIPEGKKADMETWGYSEETYLKHKDAVEAR